MATVKMKHIEFYDKWGGLMYNASNKYYLEEDGKELGVKVTFLKNAQKLQGSEKNIVKLLNQWGVPGKSLKEIQLGYKKRLPKYERLLGVDPFEASRSKTAFIVNNKKKFRR
tara:strand:- start:986 stop:1321 length:336 start_codon:yes stop_codon:yes gene_type:complete